MKLSSLINSTANVISYIYLFEVSYLGNALLLPLQFFLINYSSKLHYFDENGWLYQKTTMILSLLGLVSGNEQINSIHSHWQQVKDCQLTSQSRQSNNKSSGPKCEWLINTSVALL